MVCTNLFICYWYLQLSYLERTILMAKKNKCLGCGCEIADTSEWCGECLCEDDGC